MALPNLVFPTETPNHTPLGHPPPFLLLSSAEDWRGELEPQKAKIMGWYKNYLPEAAMR